MSEHEAVQTVSGDDGSSDNPLTLIAIEILAYIFGDMLHEAAGHGLARRDRSARGKRGRTAQPRLDRRQPLEKAVQVVMEALKKNPPQTPHRPAFPNYSKDR